VEVELPPGFVGNPPDVPQCTRGDFDAERCPNASTIGTAGAYFGSEQGGIGLVVYNLVPPRGVAAEFGFTLSDVNTYLDSTVRSGSDYGITTSSDNISQDQIIGVVTNLWGVPGDPTHDPWRVGRFGGCTQEEIRKTEEDCYSSGYHTGETVIGGVLKPFLTLPTACGKAQPFVIRTMSWTGVVSERRVFFSHDSTGDALTENDPSVTGFTGCGDLGFGPTITTAPDTAKADTPAGLTVEVKPPLGGLSDPEGLSTSDIQDTTVTLPPGLVINPGQAAGLQACPAGRPSPSEHRYGDALTTEAEKERNEEDNEAVYCPGAAKVGTVTIKTPLIEGAEEKQFEGSVYVLRSNPPDLKLLVAASADGVNLKLVGDVHSCESTGETIGSKTCEAPGQLITTFEHTPELPFMVFKLSFSGGAQAALDTPTQCGAYTTNADFTPWSSLFIPDFFTSASFGLVEGPSSGPCSSSPLPFAPELVAGSTTDRAGGFTNFSLLLERGDGQQRIERLQFKAPEGLSGMLSQVPLCPEPQAAAGACSEASRIGHATVASGPGPYPLVIPQPGEPESPIYLTGPYEGAPFGLSIVTHVLAGPFNLGTIVARARIEIDPHTAQITVTTDPLPQVVDGVPTDLRLINSVIDRPGFMFNPTNCSSQAFSGTAYGTPPPSEGGPHAQAAISSHFGVGSCRELGFSPDFKASTEGIASFNGNGAALDVKVVARQGPRSNRIGEANIASVKVSLPKVLPSRLTTLQKACLAAVFESNPAACPSSSIIGHAKVVTPLLPVPLEGPAYFISHGGEAFPSLTMVLQGYGVTVDLVGTTFINKAGITSSTFGAVPDAPFTSFELKLPEGRYSALAANTNLCKLPTKTVKVRKRIAVRRKGHRAHVLRTVTERIPRPLLMPTTIAGQNGARIEQDTKIEVTNCSKARHKARRKTTRSRTRRRKKPAPGHE
jgi:hypothetical protein